MLVERTQSAGRALDDDIESLRKEGAALMVLGEPFATCLSLRLFFKVLYTTCMFALF